MSKSSADNGDPVPDRRSRESPTNERIDPQSQVSGEIPLDDAQNWRELFDEIQPGLRRFLTGKLPQPADVDDCMQSVSIAMLKNESEIPLSARRAWLFRVAANEAALWWRKKSTTDRVIEKHTANLTPPSEHTPSPSHQSDLETQETLQQVNQAIENLPRHVGQIVRMRLIDSMTFQSIADTLELPLGTVLTRMRRAMTRLRDELDAEDFD